MDFGLFQFASPPRTATTWIRHAAEAVGLKEHDRNQVHFPHPRNTNGKNIIKVTCVRHPCFWLGSWHANIFPGLIGVDPVDSLRKHVDQESFCGAVRQYLSLPQGWIGRMFAQYNPDVVIRVEDLPWAFIELLDSLGVPKSMREQCLQIAPMNSPAKVVKQQWSPSLWARVIEAESEFMATYDY